MRSYLQILFLIIKITQPTENFLYKEFQDQNLKFFFKSRVYTENLQYASIYLHINVLNFFPQSVNLFLREQKNNSFHLMVLTKTDPMCSSAKKWTVPTILKTYSDQK